LLIGLGDGHMNRQEQLLELENERAKANKEIDNLKSGMTPGQMILVIFLLKFDTMKSYFRRSHYV
jgi:hypothetical protein